MASAGGGNIKVVVRVRPFNSRELDRKAKCVVSMNGEQTVLTPPAGELKPKNNKATLESAKTFAYDKSYWSFARDDPHFAGQSNVFDDLGKPLLDNAFQGYNNCIFAYGQTGSGKSYSMMGFGAESGVIPRICRDMFERIDALQQDKNTTCTVEVSYLEIYNERVRDLLNPATKGNLKVREHPSTGPYVEDLAKLLVRSFPEIENLMDEGNKARTVAATNMNETSSRSHAVFTLTLTQKKHDEETKMNMERVAKISLVDLAGSERANSTGATGARLKEGAEINRSLSTLGRVIAALADLSVGKKKSASMIPYRDSVLTWLLKDSLGGNSMTAMIAAISPADINFEETLSTLRYADSAKRIKNHAVVNEDANARMIRELKEELAQLRSKLGGGSGTGVGAQGGAGETEYPPDTPLEKQMVTITQADGSQKRVSKADIAEQLSQSEKLYTDLNQTWEQKLQKTEEIHKEREAALEELGISIEKGFVGLSTPKKMPHLVNLADDPLLAECLVYNLKPGNTTVGNDEMTDTAEIRLKGSKILKEHCVFENNNGVVNIVPNDDAAVMVNGRRINKAKRLHSGFRVILGDFHIFRFNHPQEARAERAERAEQGSQLKQSMTADELDDPTKASHGRSRSSVSRRDSQSSTERTRGDSMSPHIPPDQDYDWSFARREAATAILGPDQKIASLSDEELDVLFEDLQRVRANRRAPEQRLLDREDDTDSNASYPVRDKYLSSTTIDNFSLDTALTVPSTPPHGEDAERSNLVKEDLQEQLEKHKHDFQGDIKSTDDEASQASEVQAEKVTMQQSMQKMKEDMEQQMKDQKDDFEKRLQEAQNGTLKRLKLQELTLRERALARQALQKWRQRKYVRMAGQMLQHTSLLKEAQILSQQMGKTVVFQFAVVDAGQTLGSSYDLVLNGISDDDDDDLLMCSKPCIGIRVADFKHHSVAVWSLEKLELRVQRMRQMQQYLDRPEYVRHFRIDNPFSDSSQPQYSRVGEAQVTLAAVFESRVQDFVVDVISPYTFSVIGILKLSLEPSLAEAPESTMKFNVVLHDMAGFTEMEGTDVHAQLSIPRISEEGGATTTQLHSAFNEGSLRFDSVHGMSLPSSSSRDASLRISIFARVTPMHLDKLLSWDDMRDAAQKDSRNQKGARLAESEFRMEEKHDVFMRAQILELSESGDYEPVEVFQTSAMDAGAHQLHQGLQRRVVIHLSHTCGNALPWDRVSGLRAGNVHLLDSSGRPPEVVSPQVEVPLKFIGSPSMIDNADGTTNVTVTGQWDSSAHGSPLLDRTTTQRYRVQFTLRWEVESPKLREPMRFSTDISLQMQPRAFLRAPSMLTQFWNPTHAAHSTTGIFVVSVKPNPIESSVDLWRMDTQYEYVKGEEQLSGWTPRGISLIRDFVDLRKQQIKAADVEATKSVFGEESLLISEDSAGRTRAALTDHQRQLIEKFVGAWQSGPADPSSVILSASNTEPPKNGAAFATKSRPSKDTTGLPLSASVHYKEKSAALLKSGYLLTPDPSQSKWVRRYLELRRPYLHIHSVPDGDELNAINLQDSRVDHQPQVAKLLHRNSATNSQLNVFAIYARQNAFLFATRSDREKLEWVMRLDESFLSNNGVGSVDGGG
ncbi:MAG: kinesin-like protein Klp8 [Chrysothrix sp. TS-e1954]|nr:MAG: kinesin-like protein Klp8 [Chrysothrix sp. TS-e1954]